MIKRKKHKKSKIKKRESTSFLKPMKIKKSLEKQTRDQLIFKRFLDKNYHRVKKINELMGNFPKTDEQIRIITHQSFNAFSILLYLLEFKKIEELYFTTFSIDEGSVNGIKEVVKNENISKMVFVCNSLLKNDRPQRRLKLINLAKENKNFTLIEAFNHTKIIAAKTKCENYYVIEGSGNLSANARIEQYLFENSKESFEFHKNWIEDIEEISGSKDVTRTN